MNYSIDNSDDKWFKLLKSKEIRDWEFKDTHELVFYIRTMEWYYPKTYDVRYWLYSYRKW